MNLFTKCCVHMVVLTIWLFIVIGLSSCRPGSRQVGNTNDEETADAPLSESDDKPASGQGHLNSVLEPVPPSLHPVPLSKLPHASLRNQLQKGITQVILRGADILSEAHPTADFVAANFLGYQNATGTGSSYWLIFDIQYKGSVLKKNHWLNLFVLINKSGVLLEYQWGRDTGMIPPGAVSNTLKAIVKQAMEPLTDK